MSNKTTANEKEAPLARLSRRGFSSTISRTRSSPRSRVPRMYSRPRSSSAAAEIMPRSATTHTRPMPKRRRSRSTTGTSTVLSDVLPASISVHTGRPAPSMTTARIICFRSGRWSFE